MRAVLRLLLNATLLVLELAAVAALGLLAAYQPLAFAGLTALVTLVLGVWLERARLAHELPFYVPNGQRGAGTVAAVIGVGTGAAKALITGLVALLAFSGTDGDRRFWIGCALAATLFFGVSVLRRLALSFGISASRWGFFRLALPLGLVFTLLVALAQSLGLIKVPSLTELLRQMVLDVPARPTLEQASELLFRLKQYVDSVLVALLQTVLTPDHARLVGLVVSVNVLTGLVAAVWAVLIAELSMWFERWDKG